MRSGLAKLSLALAASAFVVLVAAAQAGATSGAGLLRAVDSGQRSCADLSDDEFSAIGEYVMGRMIGSPQAHESMDEYMSRMMGPGNEELMHEYMGRRMAGCGGAAMPGAAAGMMGMMGGAGLMGRGLSGVGPGARPGTPYGPPAMMGFTSRRGGDDDNDAPLGWMVAMMVLLLGGAGLAVYLVVRSGRGRPDPGDLLAVRLARGEIDPDEYERRRGLLGGAQ